MIYAFRPMTADDLDLVNRWIRTPHVAEWWIGADGGPADLRREEDLSRPGVRMWIVSLGGRPFAYMQDYDPHLYPGHHFADRPVGTRGIDQFIGAADMIGIGHGSAFVRQHVESLWSEGAPCVVTDPAPGNARAIRAYGKAGFHAFGETVSPQWGPSLLMQAKRP